MEIGVFCESGTLRVGDCVTSATAERGEPRPVDLEVVEIRFFDQLVDELAEVYSGNVVFAGAFEAEEGWILEVPSSA